MSSSPLFVRPHATRNGFIPAGQTVHVTGWRQDANGTVWYQIGANWTTSDAILLRPTNSATSPKGRRAIANAIRGKGMWLTLGVVSDIQPRALVRAASRNGISHLYVEAAISPLGFHGRSSVGSLLEAAHRANISVIAWVYPYLRDVGGDVNLTRSVAAFHSRSEDTFDGIASDLERNARVSPVRTYSQLIRAYLGKQYLLVAVTYPPGTFPNYPFSEVARVYNAIAPMDYWHETKTNRGLLYDHMLYGFDYGYRYAIDSVRALKRLTPSVAVAPIGQAFDDFGRLEMGPYAPSSKELRGFLAGARDGGAVGASFFQWMTATSGEWQVIKNFRFVYR